MKYFVEIKETKEKGRGVFAMKDFKKGEIIEACPVIHLTKKEDVEIQKTVLGRYVYEWRPNNSAIIFGYGSIYNHSYNPNAVYERDFDQDVMTYSAHDAIKKGEEITVNYNGDPKEMKAVDDFIPIKENTEN